jgi:hypothetical protein
MAGTGSPPVMQFPLAWFPLEWFRDAFASFLSDGIITAIVKVKFYFSKMNIPNHYPERKI